MSPKSSIDLINSTPFTFTYTLKDAGWASATWEAEGRTLKFRLSYLCNPLGDLLQVLNEMNEWYDDRGSLLAQSDEQNAFDWQGEPELYKFLFNPLGGRRVRLMITYQADSWFEPTQCETWLETVISLDDLQRQAFVHAEAILRDFGLAGYRLSWIDGDFPIGEFLKLKAFLTGVAMQYNSLMAEAEYFSDLVTARGRQKAALDVGTQKEHDNTNE